MRYLALATDYDGTLAHNGVVSERTWAAVRRLRDAGRKVILVTGRELEDLKTTCPHFELFDLIVAENGGLLYHPGQSTARALAAPPSAEFVARLQQHGVAPISVGHTIVATWEPHQAAVLSVIHEMGLELQLIFNKGAVMILPAGVNKATGLTAALKEMGLSRRQVVGIGDAENDHAFLSYCECSVAVANALPAVKATADFVTEGDHGDGVVELIDEMLVNDLANRQPGPGRRPVSPSRNARGHDIAVPSKIGKIESDGPEA
jgi:HAD superfamily hydrolase (TIGR01484 family)